MLGAARWASNALTVAVAVVAVALSLPSSGAASTPEVGRHYVGRSAVGPADKTAKLLLLPAAGSTEVWHAAMSPALRQPLLTGDPAANVISRAPTAVASTRGDINEKPLQQQQQQRLAVGTSLPAAIDERHAATAALNTLSKTPGTTPGSSQATVSATSVPVDTNGDQGVASAGGQTLPATATTGVKSRQAVAAVGDNDVVVVGSAGAGGGAAADGRRHNGFRDKINISNQRNEFYGQRQSKNNNNNSNNNKSNAPITTTMSAATLKVKPKMLMKTTTTTPTTTIKATTRTLKRNQRSAGGRQQQRVAAGGGDAKDGQSSFFESVEQQQNNSRNNNNNNHNKPQADDGVDKTTTTATAHTHWQEAETSSSAETSAKLLLRRKRYLVFPESSSFQLIFDLIIPIVDWTNFAIMGITCAVAWELPDKAPSEIIETVKERLNEGSLLLTRRNDSIAAPGGVQYLNAGSGSLPLAPARPLDSYYAPPKAAPVATSRWWDKQRFDSHNYNKKYDDYYSDKWSQAHWQYAYATPSPAGSSRRWQTPAHAAWQRWQQAPAPPEPWQTRWSAPPPTRAYSSAAPPRRRPRRWLKAPPVHRVYDVYAQSAAARRQRRAQSQTEPTLATLAARLAQHHLRAHLQTRQELYGKIEKLYKTRGQNGTACVQRALCETGQRAAAHRRPERAPPDWQPQRSQQQRRQEPQSFITEVLRAIFTLPHTADLPHTHYAPHIGSHYVAAHTLGGVADCAALYADSCRASFW